MTREEWLEEHKKDLSLDSSCELVITFPNEEDRKEFCLYMSESGEQSWTVWEEEYSSQRLTFLYHDENGKFQTEWIKAIRKQYKDG